jgi:FlaA1/EpsC-like NDP-sugar epimerase
MIATLAELPVVQAVLQRVRQYPVSLKIAIVAVADLNLCGLLVFTAYGLRVSAFVLPQDQVLHLYLVAPLLSVGMNYALGIYWSASRSHSTTTEVRIVQAQLAAAVLWILVLFALGIFGFARSVVVIYLVLSALGMVLMRRFIAEVFTSQPRTYAARQEPVVIFGAAREGLAALNAIKRQRRFKAVAFVDTDYTLVGRTVAGLPVHAIEDIDAVFDKHHPREFILAKSNLTRSGRRTLVDQVVGKGIIVKTIPDQLDFLENELNFSELKPINVEDLLGRDPVPPDRALMERAVKEQVVMVTGAGGSIGSELVRQAHAYGPRKLILVENNEFALFEVHRALEASQAVSKSEDCVLVPLLADVRDGQRMTAIMQEHAVDIVFHAAAYKHVRMVQENVGAGIDNNVFGTKAVAEAALAAKVKRFVLISTDKAVRPTSAMGASKRVAEMIVQAMAAEKGHSTIFSMVRFGNVLGSTGSVVPLFREQIAKGGPITVTHPEVTRYFMLIPEAAQLVIQAGAMAEGGEVFVLDMGEPVKIMELAETMVELAGLTLKTPDAPDGDIEIRITGLQAGEKLYEELQIGNDISKTSHDRIMRAQEFYVGRKEIARLTTTLATLSIDQRNAKLFQIATLDDNKRRSSLH